MLVPRHVSTSLYSMYEDIKNCIVWDTRSLFSSRWLAFPPQKRARFLRLSLVCFFASKKSPSIQFAKSIQRCIRVVLAADEKTILIKKTHHCRELVQFGRKESFWLAKKEVLLWHKVVCGSVWILAKICRQCSAGHILECPTWHMQYIRCDMVY